MGNIAQGRLRTRFSGLRVFGCARWVNISCDNAQENRVLDPPLVNIITGTTTEPRPQESFTYIPYPNVDYGKGDAPLKHYRTHRALRFTHFRKTGGRIFRLKKIKCTPHTIKIQIRLIHVFFSCVQPESSANEAVGVFNGYGRVCIRPECP